MPKNKLTQQEKQMPEVRLPFRYPAICLVCLFCILITASAFAVTGGFPSLLYLLIGIMALPSLAGLIAYFNHSIRFDKENVVYRDYFRRLHRFHFEDIKEIKTENQKLYFTVADKKIFVNKDHSHGKWLMELAEKKHVPTDERTAKQFSQGNQKRDGLIFYNRNLYFSLIGTLVFIAFVICLPIASVTIPTEKELTMTKVIIPTSAFVNDSYEKQAPKYKDNTKELDVIIRTNEDYTYWLNIYGWEEERVNHLLTLAESGEPITVHGIGGTEGMTIYEAYDSEGNLICAKEEEEDRAAARQSERKAKAEIAVKILGGILLLHMFLWWNIHRIPKFMTRFLILCFDIPSKKFIETLPPKRESLRPLAYRRRVYAKDHFGLKDDSITETLKKTKKQPIVSPKQKELSEEILAKVEREIKGLEKEAEFWGSKTSVYLIVLGIFAIITIISYILKAITV